jgi:hypothetical protein
MNKLLLALTLMTFSVRFTYAHNHEGKECNCSEAQKEKDCACKDKECKDCHGEGKTCHKEKKEEVIFKISFYDMGPL